MTERKLLWGILITSAIVYTQFCLAEWELVCTGVIPPNAWPALIILCICAGAIGKSYAEKK